MEDASPPTNESTPTEVADSSPDVTEDSMTTVSLDEEAISGDDSTVVDAAVTSPTVASDTADETHGTASATTDDDENVLEKDSPADDAEDSESARSEAKKEAEDDNEVDNAGDDKNGREAAASDSVDAAEENPNLLSAADAPSEAAVGEDEETTANDSETVTSSLQSEPSPAAEEEEEEEEEEEDFEPPQRFGVKKLGDSDQKSPIEELITNTIRENPIYNTRELLLDEANPHAMLFWAKTISQHAKRMKSYYLRKRKGDKADEDQFQWSSNQVVTVYINFHSNAVEKFAQCARLDPLNSFQDIASAKSVPLNTDRPRRNKAQKKFPVMELCYEWGLAAFRYGKALENQRDFEAAFTQYNTAAKLFMKVVQEDRRRKVTALVFNKIVFVFERLAKVKPTSSEVRSYCDLFLIQFSNIAMRGEMKSLNLKPLIAMVLSDSRHVRESCAIDVVKHLATFFDTDIGKEASKQMEYLNSILVRTQDKEAQLQRLLTPEAKKRLEKSGLKREEYLQHTDVLINLLRWKGKPPCRLPSIKAGDLERVREMKEENPKKLFVNRYRLVDEEHNSNAHIFLAKRKSDKVPVAIKVMKKYSENEAAIKQELAILETLSGHDNFTHLLDVYLYRDEVWAVSEYCDAGNLVDFIPVSMMKEDEIAYICKQILEALAYLHQNQRMHRDLTSDDILLNMSGDVLVADFELWMGSNQQRYWLAPELLLSEPYPYGSEVDVWSFGCILMEMADGHPPYSDLHPLKEFFYTATKGAPDLAKANRWSREFKTFLASALDSDPKKRSTATELLQHPFIQKACTRQQFSEIVHLKVSWTRW